MIAGGTSDVGVQDNDCKPIDGGGIGMGGAGSVIAAPEPVDEIARPAAEAPTTPVSETGMDVLEGDAAS
jgi:hypothetical protein